MQTVLTNGSDFILLTWPTSIKEFEKNPEVRFRIPNKTVVEPGIKLQATANTKDKGWGVYYVIKEILEVKESLTSQNQNIITARVDRLVE